MLYELLQKGKNMIITNKALAKLSESQISLELKRFKEELSSRLYDREAEKGLFDGETCLTYRSLQYKFSN